MIPASAIRSATSASVRPEDPLVGPAHAVGDDDGGVGAVMGRQGGDDLGHLRGGEEQGHGRPVPGQRGEVFARRGRPVLPAARVRMTVWLLPAGVYSIFRAAAAAWKELTPGTTS